MKYIVLLCSCFTLCSCSYKRSSGLSENYIFEKDFYGAALIVYSVNNPTETPSMDSSRTFLIPSNGILVTDCSFAKERRPLPKCWVVDSVNNLKEIPYVINPDSTTYGKYCCCLSIRKRIGELSGIINYSALFIGTSKQIESAYSSINYSLLDSIVYAEKNKN